MMNKRIYVFADWETFSQPELVGVLSSDVVRGKENRKSKLIAESDYLLGIHDINRIGALRFKTELDGPFLDNNARLAASPLSYFVFVC